MGWATAAVLASGGRYRNGNYCAFYVKEPFSHTSLGAHQTRDFNYYHMLEMWRKQDASFPFNDSHDKNYNVRDGSDWEGTLRPRLRERLRESKNIILFLSSITKESRALKEEIDYGINEKGLPVIVIYPDCETKDGMIGYWGASKEVKNLWARLPVFIDSMGKVPTLHIPMKKDLIEKGLRDPRFMVLSKANQGVY